MDLTEFAEGGKKGPKTKAPFVLAPLVIKFQGDILAFDQTSSKLPWAYIHFVGGNALPRKTGMYEPPQCAAFKKGSAEDILGRCDLIYMQAVEIIDALRPTLIVHESPPQGRGKFLKPETSYTPAMAIRCAAKRTGTPVRMIHAQKAKMRFTGDQGADKVDVHAAMLTLVPYLGELKPNNADTRDAAALAIVAAEEST